MKFKVIICGLLLSASFILNATAAKPEKRDKDMDLSIRQLVDKYYPNGKFYFGASSIQEYYKNPNKKSGQFFNEFSYNTPANSFKQSGVYPQPNAKWNADEYSYFIQKAREFKQVIRCHGPISPQCSRWAMADNRTPEELNEVLEYYMTKLSKDLEANKDVVKWMDVVNEVFAGSIQKGTGYDGKETENVITYQADDWFGPKKGDQEWQNPWTQLGFEHVVFNGQTLEIPNYVLKAFKIANANAPGVKLIWNDHGKTTNPKIFEKLKVLVMYLRSIGLRIDGIGWQAHVFMGWETNPENVKNLENVIDWCYQNKLEFHITELDVTLKLPKDTDISIAEYMTKTRQEQAETFAALTETILKKVGKGANSINLWTMYDRNHGEMYFAGLFDIDGNPNPAYYSVKNMLIKYGGMSK